MRYSDNRLPKAVVNESTLLDKVYKWKEKWHESECNLRWHKNRADFCDMRIEECCVDIKALRLQNSDLKFAHQTLDK